MRELIAPIYAAADRYLYWLNMPTISKTDVAEIIIIAFILYHILLWFKNTRAWMLFRDPVAGKQTFQCCGERSGCNFPA